MLIARTSFNSAKASFQTHSNYVKRMGLIFHGCKISATKAGGPPRLTNEIKRFSKLHELTALSIKKDIELSKQDPDFAVIIAPWFAVKCYYSLYYLESVLVHLINGSKAGYGSGGHTAIRTQIQALVSAGNITFSKTEVGTIRNLNQIQTLPAIRAGQNTRSNFWESDSCTNSVLKKLSEYKLHHAQNAGKWNLKTKKGKEAKRDFMSTKSLMLNDFFYWYRIKANYRDLDYIDFENGVTPQEVLGYINSFDGTYTSYCSQLESCIKSLTN